MKLMNESRRHGDEIRDRCKGQPKAALGTHLENDQRSNVVRRHA